MPVYLSAFRQSYPEVPGAVAEIVPAPVLSSAGSLVTTIYPVDRDGIVRSMPSGDDFSFGRVPHVSAALDRSSDDEVGRFIDMAIDRRAMPRIPFVDALSEDGLAAAVAGKTVFVGATAVELGDEFAIPVHGLQPGVVLNAIAYESLRRGSEKRRAPLWVTSLIAACVCAFTTLRIGRGSAVLYALAQSTLLITVMIIGPVVQLAADVSVILAPIYLCRIGAAARHTYDIIDDRAAQVFRAQMHIQKQAEVMDTIMQANHDGIVLLDRNGLVVACNARAAMLLGLEPDTAVGRDLMTIAPRLTTISPGDDTTLIEVSRNREEPLST